MNSPIDLTKLELTELKSLAYDFLVNVENAQANLKAVNAEIQKRIQPAQVVPPLEPKKAK